jgi:hypothetical protein
MANKTFGNHITYETLVFSLIEKKTEINDLHMI